MHDSTRPAYRPSAGPKTALSPPHPPFLPPGSSDASAVLTRIGPSPSAAGGTASLLLMLLAALVAMLAVLAGLLLHFAQSRPDELRQLLAPLAPSLAAAAEAHWLPDPLRGFLRQLT